MLYRTIGAGPGSLGSCPPNSGEEPRLPAHWPTLSSSARCSNASTAREGCSRVRISTSNWHSATRLRVHASRPRGAALARSASGALFPGALAHALGNHQVPAGSAGQAGLCGLLLDLARRSRGLVADRGLCFGGRRTGIDGDGQPGPAPDGPVSPIRGHVVRELLSHWIQGPYEAILPCGREPDPGVRRSSWWPALGTGQLTLFFAPLRTPRVQPT